MDYSIRESSKEDIPRLLELERLCFPDPWSEEMFQTEFDNPLIRYYVAEQDRIIAYIGFLVVAGECQINNVAVHPDYKRRGIASELMELMINETEDEGVTAWTLEVRVGNAPALRLYEKFGFRQVGLRPNYYEDGAGALLMTREIASEPEEEDAEIFDTCN